MTLRTVARAALAAVIVAAGVTAVATQAAAATTVTRIEAASSYDGIDIKTAVAYCPPTTRVLGGGGDISGSLDIHLVGVHPDTDANAYVAVAREHTPTGGPWKVIAHAVCAPMPTGWHVVDTTVGPDSSPSKDDNMLCGPGEKVLGVGARVTAPSTAKLVLTYVAPTATGNGTRARAVEMAGGYTGSWSLRIWAVCALPPTGWQTVFATGDPGVYWAAKTCPGTKKLTTAGAYIHDPLDSLFLREVAALDYVSDSRPVDTSSAAAGWLGGTPPNHDWYIQAYGICVS